MWHLQKHPNVTERYLRVKDCSTWRIFWCKSGTTADSRIRCLVGFTSYNITKQLQV